VGFPSSIRASAIRQAPLCLRHRK